MSKYQIGKKPTEEVQLMWAAALDRCDKTEWTEWNKTFHKNIFSLLKRTYKLSEAQIWKLEEMYARYTN